MKGNGEAIQGTTASLFDALPFGRCTVWLGGATTKLYLHVFDWPAEGPLAVPGVRAKVRAVRLLSGNRPLAFSQQANVLTIQPGGIAPDPHATVLAIDTR